MANNHLQFLEIPRRDPEKLAVEERIQSYREIYTPYDAGERRATGGTLHFLRQSVLRMEMPGSQLHSELVEAHRGRESVRGSGALTSHQFAARKSADASARRIVCAKARAR